MAAQALEAQFYHGNDQKPVDYTPATALVNGQVVRIGTGNFTGVCMKTQGIAANVLGALATAGTFRVRKAETGGVTFAVGALVDWDDLNNTAVAATTGIWTMGMAEEAAAAGDNHVKVRLNEEPVD